MIVINCNVARLSPNRALLHLGYHLVESDPGTSEWSVGQLDSGRCITPDDGLRCLLKSYGLLLHLATTPDNGAENSDGE